MQSVHQNPEYRNFGINPENFNPSIYKYLHQNATNNLEKQNRQK